MVQLFEVSIIYYHLIVLIFLHYDLLYTHKIVDIYILYIIGDTNSITIGDNVTVGDRAMIHVSGTTANKPTTIGNNVIIESGATIHGSTVEDNTYIGSGSQILDGALIKTNSYVGAGSVVAQGKVVPSGQLWAGKLSFLVCTSIY